MAVAETQGEVKIKKYPFVRVSRNKSGSHFLSGSGGMYESNGGAIADMRRGMKNNNTRIKANKTYFNEIMKLSFIVGTTNETCQVLTSRYDEV